MNSAIILARVAEPPQIKTASDKQIAIFAVEVTPYSENDPPFLLQVAAFGKVAEAVAAAAIQPDTYLDLVGRLRIEKGRPPELQISEFHQVTPREVPGVNIVHLVGRAGRDPDVRFFESGSTVANLTLAVNRIRRDDGPDWFNLAIWGKQAQVAADYVRKGSLLGITGSLQMETWTDRATGEERSKPVIRVTRLDLLGSRHDAGSHGGDQNDEEAPY